MKKLILIVTILSLLTGCKGGCMTDKNTLKISARPTPPATETIRDSVFKEKAKELGITDLNKENTKKIENAMAADRARLAKKVLKAKKDVDTVYDLKHLPPQY